MVKERIILKLKQDSEQLLRKMDKCMTDDNFGTYKNLVSALKGNLDIINELDGEWKLHYSEYKTTNEEGQEVPQVSIWEQCGGEVKNHKVYVLNENWYSYQLPKPSFKKDFEEMIESFNNIEPVQDDCALSYDNNKFKIQLDVWAGGENERPRKVKLQGEIVDWTLNF